MATSRIKKEEIVKNLETIFGNTESLVFVNFHGLNVKDSQTLRHELKENGVKYIVAKKTLIKRVLEKTKIQGEAPLLNGELALAYGSDYVLPAQGIMQFQKKHEGVVAPLGGILDGRYITAGEVKNLSRIPSREILYGQFVTTINAPLQQTVQVLNAVTQSFVNVLSQVAKAKV